MTNWGGGGFGGGILNFFAEGPSTLSLRLFREDGQWKSEQTLHRENGDKLTTMRTLWLNSDKLIWWDDFSESLFEMVYTGNQLVGHVSKSGKQFRQSGSRFGVFTLERCELEYGEGDG